MKCSFETTVRTRITTTEETWMKKKWGWVSDITSCRTAWLGRLYVYCIEGRLVHRQRQWWTTWQTQSSICFQMWRNQTSDQLIGWRLWIMPMVDDRVQPLNPRFIKVTICRQRCCSQSSGNCRTGVKLNGFCFRMKMIVLQAIQPGTRLGPVWWKMGERISTCWHNAAWKFFF